MISRRQFVQTGVAVTGGLMLNFGMEASDAADGGASFGAYLEIAPDGTVFITCPQSEMGQGVHDGLPKILADELGADWARVVVRMPQADDAFINPITKRHRTANSESTVVYFDVMRKAGASAREMLVAAAASAWSVPSGECKVTQGRVQHQASARSGSIGEFAAAAARLPVPSAPTFKPANEYTLIGRATPRKDTPAKTDGTLVFGIDVRLPDMLYAALRRSPAVASKLVSFSRESALRQPGVVDAYAISDGVAVLANSTWHARRAAEALDAQFDDAPANAVESTAMHAKMTAALDADERALVSRPAFGGAPFDRNATRAAIDAAPTRHEWVYEVPFLAHAALEPLCATAVVRPDSCEVWAPTQQPDRARDAMAQITGLPRAACRLNVTFIGGGFGRKWEIDFVRQVVEIAKQRPGRPIKLTWTREQDFAHDRYRPAHIVRTRVGTDRDGQILGMHSRTTGISMWKYQNRPTVPGLADPFASGLLINDHYEFPNKCIDYVETPDPVPVGTWRSVAQSMNGFFSESAIDDVAHATRQDPFALRLRLLAKDERATKLLLALREKSDWGKRLPRGRGRGVAFTMGFDSYCAQVVEVTVKKNVVKVDRIVAVFDCGIVVDPHNVEAQVEGGIVWGLSAALNGRISFANGAAIETNFDSAPVLRLHEMPRIEVHLLPSGAKPGGAGEASVPPVASALAGAIQMATGQRPRRLPLTDSGYALA
jgi:isoquinoline 1-oxidoreductase beta subunit